MTPISFSSLASFLCSVRMLSILTFAKIASLAFLRLTPIVLVGSICAYVCVCVCVCVCVSKASEIVLVWYGCNGECGLEER